MRQINCAVYVRKSTEHGLDQKFNSLQNQEEACKSYIASQAFNGWGYYKTFADGGISGGTMERPSLQEMLEEIRLGKIQIVVVYKVDRLSRSIVDFHKMMTEFKKYDCDFVSITQAFDTSNSMGKLTLNMLLSFAQFEREVSSERVRDKIAATKAKGLWTGGSMVIGYDVVDRKIVPNAAELPLINEIFQKYLQADSMKEVLEWLVAKGVKTKHWKSIHTKREHGGEEIYLSYLHRMLRNPIYIGKITHYAVNKVYDGQHQAIVPKELFEQVQSKLLGAKKALKEKRNYSYSQNLFSNILFDEKGEKYAVTCASGGARKFRYYKVVGAYLPAGQLDDMALININKLPKTDLGELLPQDTKAALRGVDAFKQSEVKRFIDKAVCAKAGKTYKLSIYINVERFCGFMREYGEGSVSGARLVRNDGGIGLSSDGKHLIIEAEFVIDNSSSTKLRATCANNIITVRQMNESLVRGLALGWKFAKEMERGKTARELEKETGLQHRTIYRYINLKYLSPNIVRSIFENKNPLNLHLSELMSLADNHLDFVEQEREWELL